MSSPDGDVASVDPAVDDSFRDAAVVLYAARIETACQVMHDAYERAAVGAGWETNPAARVPWAGVPDENKATMRAAVAELLAWLDAGVTPPG